MRLLALLTPAAVLGLFWAMQRVEAWLSRTTRPTRVARTPALAVIVSRATTRSPSRRSA